MFILLFITYILFNTSYCAVAEFTTTFKAYLSTDNLLKTEITSLKLNTLYLVKLEFDFSYLTSLDSSTDYIGVNFTGFKKLEQNTQASYFSTPTVGTNSISYKASNILVFSGAPWIVFQATTGASLKDHKFKAFIYRDGSPITNLFEMSTFKIFTVVGGSITFSLSVPNKKISKLSDYKISITLSNPLSEGLEKKITFPLPNQITQADGSLTCSGDTSSVVCSYSSSSKLVSITGLNSNTAQIITIKFANPLSTSATNAFTSFISWIDDVQVDSSSTSQTVAGYNDGIIIDLTVDSNKQKVGQTGASIIYKFTNLNEIQTGSNINLKLPGDIVWDASPYSCSLTYSSGSAVCSSSNSNDQEITLTLTSSTSISAATYITLSINSIRTAYSFKPVTGFSLIVSKSSDEQDKNTNFGTLTMTQQSGINLSYSSRTIHLNGANSDYTFSIKFDTLQPKDAKLTFTLNGYQLGSVDKVKINGQDFTSSTTLVVSSSSYTITIQLTQDLISATAFDAIIYNIKNLDSQGTGTITAETTLSSYKISSTQYGQSGTLPASIPNLITVSQMNLDKQQLGVVDQYQFGLGLANSLSDGCSIIITIPDNFQAVMQDCETAIDSLSGFTLDTCQVNSKEIKITTKTAEPVNSISFKLNNLIRNPKIYSSSYYFQFRTEKSSMIMDKSDITDSKSRFIIKCESSYSTSFCKDCDGSGNCSSCYSDTSITSNIYLLNNKCLSACGQKFYSDSSNKCQGCPTYCQECTSSSSCQSCIDETFYEIKNGKCVLKCTEKQFDFNGTCTDCNDNCNTCVDQSTKCTSCGETNNLLYQNKCVSQCPTGIFQVGFSCVACTSPCKTCDTGPTICLTCVANYYYKKASQSCVVDCGNRYFKDGSDCTQCSDPCNNCSSSSICIDCLTGYYFFNNSCVSTVPNGYYKSGTSLIKCPDICGNCISETECTSCPTNKYLLSKQCIDKCPDNYYSANFVCYPCDASCLQCTSSTQCTQCPEGQSQLQGKCYLTCPNKYYSQDLQCLQCQSSCSTCVNGLECKTCPVSAPYMLNSLCVSSCQTNYYIKSYVCYKCSNECATCDEKGCLTCITNYKYFEQTCLTSCPSGYQDLNNVGICEKVTDSEQQVISNLQENKYIPVPFTIVSLVMILSVVVAKIQKSETFIPGSAVGLLGLVIVGSWAVLLILQLDYILEKLETYLLMAALGVHIILNLINLCVIKNSTQGDNAFNQWYSSRKSNSCAYISLNVISVLSFSMTRFYFSRYFGFRFLKCKLSDVDNMIGLNIINGLCAFLCCIPALIASVLLAYRDQLREQLFVSSIDSFIVTIIFGICLIWETQKEENFFEDVNYASVSQSHQIIPEFFQTQRSKQSKRFSFEESINGQKFNHQEQDEEPAFPKIDESIEYKDPNYSQQPFEKMIQKNSQFGFKQEFPNPKQDISNRSQEEVVLQIPNNDVSSPLSIGESQIDIKDIQQKQTLEQQQISQMVEEQKRIEFEKQKELQRQLEEQNKIEEQKQIEQQKKLEEQRRLEEQKIIEEQLKQEEINKQEKLAELKRIENFQKQEQERLKQEELERIRKEKEQQILEDQRKQQELLIQQQQEAQRLEELKEQERIAQETKRLEKLKEDERLAQQKQIEEEKRQIEQKKIEEQQQAEQLRQEEEKRIQEEQKIKEQEEEARRILEEQKLQEELEQKKKEEELKQLLEEQQLQQQKEQEMIQRSKQSRQSADQNSEIQFMQNEIEDLKQDIDDLDQPNDNKLNDIILVDHDDDDVGWNIENDENDEQIYDQSVAAQQKKMQKEIIQDDKNDADDDWDVPTSGFVSVQPKSQLRKDQQIEEPVNPFKGYNQKQAAESDLFKQSRDDSDDEDWAANQISPSEFNILNQRFDNEKHSAQIEKSKKFSQTGQNFKSVIKRPTLPDPQINSDNESIDQQSVFDQFARNQLNQIPKKQNQGLNKIYLQRQQIKQKGSNNIGINDIKF